MVGIVKYSKIYYEVLENIEKILKPMNLFTKKSEIQNKTFFLRYLTGRKIIPISGIAFSIIWIIYLIFMVLNVI